MFLGSFCVHQSILQFYPGTQRFSRSWTSMRGRGGWRGRMWENLWMHMLGPLNALIQWEAIFRVSQSNSDSEIPIMTSDWISAFKGPNMCIQRFSHIFPLSLMLVREWENLWVPEYFNSKLDSVHFYDKERMRWQN